MSIQKKLRNLYVLYYTLTLTRDFSSDPAKIKQDQNRRVHKLMKNA